MVGGFVNQRFECHFASTRIPIFGDLGKHSRLVYYVMVCSRDRLFNDLFITYINF